MKEFIVEEPIVCADGFSFSVQASYGHYCSPRMSDAEVYVKLEVGFPSQPEGLLGDTCDGDVWGYVSSEVIREIIVKHGGSENIPERLKKSIG